MYLNVSVMVSTNFAVLFLSLEETRTILKDFFTKSKFGFWYEHVLIFISVGSSVEYICQSYISRSSIDILQQLNMLEKLLSFIFMCDWILNFILADHKALFVKR